MTLFGVHGFPAMPKEYGINNPIEKTEFFKSWITRILINCAILELRKNKWYTKESEWESEE